MFEARNHLVPELLHQLSDLALGFDERNASTLTVYAQLDEPFQV